ncbi:MAG: ATP-binding protein [Coriobacteriales bacterium]
MPANDNMGLFGAIHQVRDVQLVNWSLFRGYHRFSLSVDFDEPAPTVLTGDSGIGKSAIIDAIFEVLAKNPKYNPASNKGTRGSSTSKDSRTLVSYIRGKTSNEQSEEGMETQLMHSPVDQPVWSAIVITAVNDMGGLSVVGKAYWADAGCDNNSGVACVMFTAKEEFDPRCLDPISSARFTARALENLGFETLETYSSLTSFTAAVYSMLGISNNADPDKVIELLTAARAGSQFPSVGELFKDMVLTTPSALAAAEEAVEGFDVVSGSWQRIQTIEKKRRCLQGLPEHVSAWRNGQELLRGLSEVDEGAAAAAIAEVQREYAVIIDEMEARDHILEKRERRAETLQEEYEKVEDDYNAAAAALLEGGEAEVERLRQLSADAVKKLKDVREQRDSLRKSTAELFGDIPLTEEDYVEWKQSALDRLESQDGDMSKAHKRLAELAIERAKNAEERDALIEQRRYMEENRGKVPLGLRRARTGLAEVLGVDPSELPFAAELMEIVDKEHTGAVEGALYDLARTILVDSHLARDFGPLAEGLSLGARTRVEFADAGMEAEPLGKRGYASSLVSLDAESPFCGWLSKRIAREDTDALVTDAASLADAEGVAVTARGQLRDGSRGALGSDGSHIIGIDNAAAIAEADRRLAEIAENLEQIAADESDAKDELNDISSAVAAAHLIEDVSFEKIDLRSAQAERDMAAQRLTEFENTHDLERLRRERKRIFEEMHDAYDAYKEAVRSFEDYKRLIGTVRHVLNDGGRRNPAPTAAVEMVRERCEKADVGALEAWALLGNMSTSHLVKTAQERLGALSTEAEGHRMSAESIMRAYDDKWGDGFEGTSISCADYYLEIQADLARESVENLSEKWIEDMYQYVNQQICALDTALDRDKREVAAKVAELNDVMAPLPFGLEHGTLELVLEWSEPACFTEWRREVASLRKQAGSSSIGAGIDAASLMRRTAKAVEAIRERPSNLKASPSEVAAHTMERAKVLDRRTHLNLFARDTYRDADGLKHMKVIRSLNTSSGGECQEASAFIQAIALLCALRCDTVSGKPHPSFGLVILDEAFVKSSPAFAKRGIAAWCACGFQVLMAVPSNNAQCVFEKAKVAYSIIRDGRNRSAIAPQILVEKGDVAEPSDEAGR